MTDAGKPDAELRAQAVAAIRRLDDLGLNRGSTGNLSLRAGDGDGCWITPTGMAADEIGSDDLVRLAADGTVLQGRWAPSSRKITSRCATS